MNINDRPRPQPCPACGEPTLAAWRDGLYETVNVDPVALTVLGELQAQMAGRETFDHWGGPTGGLDTRRAAAIARSPAGDRSHPIRPEHRCGSPPAFDCIPDRIPDTHHDQPPF